MHHYTHTSKLTFAIGPLAIEFPRRFCQHRARPFLFRIPARQTDRQAGRYRHVRSGKSEYYGTSNESVISYSISSPTFTCVIKRIFAEKVMHMKLNTFERTKIDGQLEFRRSSNIIWNNLISIVTNILLIRSINKFEKGPRSNCYMYPYNTIVKN